MTTILALAATTHPRAALTNTAAGGGEPRQYVHPLPGTSRYRALPWFAGRLSRRNDASASFLALASSQLWQVQVYPSLEMQLYGQLAGQAQTAPAHV
jgi:hypothetical protein